MDYGMIGKIEKARRYAEQPERMTFKNFTTEFRGDNSLYTLTLNDKNWNCTCPGFKSHNICPHIMTLERLFRPMLKRDPVPYAPGQNVVSDVEKSKRYAEEKDRITFLNFTISFQGENSVHQTTFNAGSWDCDCSFFKTRGVCVHTMALERVLKGMIPLSAAAVSE